MLKCIYELQPDDVFRFEGEDKWYEVRTIKNEIKKPLTPQLNLSTTTLELYQNYDITRNSMDRIDVLNAKLTAIIKRSHTDPNVCPLLIELNRHDY